jgi:hypothetical protein
MLLIAPHNTSDWAMVARLHCFTSRTVHHGSGYGVFQSHHISIYYLYLSSNTTPTGCKLRNLITEGSGGLQPVGGNQWVTILKSRDG